MKGSDARMERKSEQAASILSLTVEQERSYIDWQDELGRQWQAARFVARMPGGINPQAKQRCFLDRLTPKEALARLIREDAETFQTRQEAIVHGAAEREGLTQAKLSRFISWSSSRHNEYRKAEVVKQA